MPSGPFAHVCLLVEDLDKAVEDWTKLLKVLDPGQLEEPLVRYEDFEGGEDQMRWATFVSNGGAEIQLMEPSADSPLGRRLAEEGLSTSGEVSSDPTMPWQRWTWVLSDSAHGTLVEVARPYRAVDGKWESASPDDA